MRLILKFFILCKRTRRSMQKSFLRNFISPRLLFTNESNEGYIKGYVALVDNKKIGLPLIIFCNVSLAVHDDEHIERFKEEIRNIDEIMECYSTGGIYDFFVKVVLKDLDAYNQFVFEKLTKVHGIVKMQSSFVLNEIKHTTVLNIPKNS